MAGFLETLSPAQALTRLYKMDAQSARFLAGGIGVFAAAATVAAFKVDLVTMMLTGFYILVMGLALLIVSALPPVLRLILGTFVVIVIISTTVMLFLSAAFDIPKPAYCLTKFWLKCEIAEEQTADRNATTIESAFDLPRAIARPAGATSGASASNGVGSVPNQTVYIQFAGLITRDSIGELNAALRRGGWQVAGTSGERTGSAAGLSEVRYGPAGDQAAAQALADAVGGVGISDKTVSIRRVGSLPGKTLELWISR